MGNNIAIQFKDTIRTLVETGELDEAKVLLEEYKKLNKYDVDIYSIAGVIAMMEGDMEGAEEHLKKGLDIDSSDADLLYNLAYLYKNTEGIHGENHIQPTLKKRIVFFVKKGMDSFLGDIIENLSYDYEVRKIIVENYGQIDEGMEWADICWFEWCDELITYGSKLPVARTRKIICRLHSYEAFEDYPKQVNWEVVDKVIFIAKHIKEFVVENSNLDEGKTVIIQNGVNLDKWSYKIRERGFKIAYVGYINYKKGPMLLLHTFKAIYEKDNRYKLHIAGEFQDNRDIMYFNQMIKEFGLQGSVIYEGWQNNLDKWLEDKNYILCTSVLESQNMSVMQAMAKGIKPIVHNFVGARDIYDNNYVWNTIDEAVSMVRDAGYDSQQYIDFVREGYLYEDKLNSLKLLINQLQSNTLVEKIDKKGPLVSICITSYNYSNYLGECIESVVNQTYGNMELIIIDDCSTDNSRDIIDQYSKQYDFIKPIYNDSNKGYVYGISRFIESLCTGEYFIILSADDTIAKNDTVQQFVEEHTKNPNEYDIIYGDEIIINETNNTASYVNIEGLSNEEVIRRTFNSFGAGVLPYLFAMHRTSFYRDNGYSWETYKGGTNDTLNSLFAIKRGAKFKKLDYPMFNYRYHSNNMTFNLELRIVEVLAIVDYITHNFDREDYMHSGLIANNMEEQKELDRVFFAHYYYNLITYYLNDYKVYGIWDLNITNEEKIQALKECIKRCKDYMDSYFTNGNKKFEEIMTDIRTNMLEICGGIE